MSKCVQCRGGGWGFQRVRSPAISVEPIPSMRCYRGERVASCAFYRSQVRRSCAVLFLAVSSWRCDLRRRIEKRGKN